MTPEDFEWHDPDDAEAKADDDALPDDGDEFDPADPEQMAYDDAHEESWNGRD